MILMTGVPVVAQECSTLQGASPNDLVSHISRVEPNQKNASCVAFAIHEIGNQLYEPAIPILTKLLDFRWPRDKWQKQRYFPDAPNPADVQIFPAATALEKIGKNSLPAVLEAVKAESTSRIARETAVTVWMAIYKNEAPKAVALLKQEADRTKDPATRQRVGWAAFKALNWCVPADQAQCQAAVSTTYSK